MTYSRLNPEGSNVVSGAVAKSGFSVAGQRYMSYGPFAMFFLNATTDSALAAGTQYNVATIPFTPKFGGATMIYGVAALGTDGTLSVRPTMAIPAGSTLYMRGYFAL